MRISIEKKSSKAFTMGAIFLLMLSLPRPAAALVRTFSPTGSMSTARYGSTATLLPNGKVLVAGGFGSAASAELYDAATGLFSWTGSMSTARPSHTATLLPNGKVLVAGGNLASAELYDPSTGLFSSTGSMSIVRSAHTATLLPSGKVLVTGGTNSSFPPATASAELYDPSTGLFSPTGSMSSARYFHTATLLSNGDVLVVGGTNLFSNPLSGELYSSATGLFSSVGSMSTARSFHTATLLPNGKVLVAGGFGSAARAELYDPATGLFSSTGSMSIARTEHIATLLPNGNVLVAGGSNFPYGLASAELYDPATGLFSSTGSMNTGRFFHTATLLSNGKVLIAGGTDGSSPLASGELYISVPTDRGECKNNGWMTLSQPDGSPFKNEGDCIQFVNTGDYVIFNNTNNSTNPVCCGYGVGLYPGSANVFIDAFPFTVQGGSYRLDEVRLLTSIDGAVGPTPSGLSLFVYADSGGKPGAVLESWQAIPVGSTITLQTAMSSNHPILQQGQQYWFGVTTTNPAETAIWWINPALSQSTECGFFNGALFPCATLATGAFEILGSSSP